MAGSDTVLRYLSSTPDLGLCYPTENNFALSVYTDSDYAGDRNDRKSTSGFAAFLGESLISWNSSKQNVVTLSSCEAEYLAIGFGAREALWLRAFLGELKLEQESTPVFVDNTSAIRLVENPEFHKASKHIAVKYHFVRDLNESEQISTQFVPSGDQRADIFTKALDKTKFETNREKLNMVETKPVPLSPSEQTAANMMCGLRQVPSNRGMGKFGLLNMIMCLMLLIFSTDAVHITSSRPILWRKSKIPIITGYEKIYIKLQLVSPCTLITAQAVYYENLQDARRMCEEVYQRKFLDELGKMCPPPKGTVKNTKTRRVVPILALIVVGLVMAGAALSDLVLSVSTSRRLGQAENVITAQQQALDSLAQENNLTELAVNKLRRDFNQLAEELESHEFEFDDFRKKSPSTHFILSSIMAGLTIGTPIIKGGAREFRRGKVSPLLLDYLNITLPCELVSCPMDHATADRCSLITSESQLEIEISIPTIDPEMYLVSVDPFDFLVQTENKTCRAVYTGPSTAVLGPSGCPVALDVQISEAYSMVYAASKECLPDNKQDSSYFKIKSCKEKQDGDEKQFIQVKSHHGFLYIYCYMSTIAIENQEQPCPNEVFILPVGTKFSINGKDFVGSVVNILHQESPHPFFTLKTNHHLNPRLNYSELLKDPMLNHTFHYKAINAHFGTTPDWMLALLVGAAVTIGVLILIIVVCYYYNRKVKIEVVKIPKQRLPMSDTAPAWVFNQQQVIPEPTPGITPDGTQ